MVKSIVSITCIALLLLACHQEEQREKQLDADNATSGYDSLLALEVGADAYGMRSYVMAYLKAGPNRSQDSLETSRLQRAHLDNITRMAEEGKLILAGPFLDAGEFRGIYVFAVETIAEAEELTKSDPAVQAGRLKMELHPWYGSAALMKLNEVHSKIAKQGI